MSINAAGPSIIGTLIVLTYGDCRLQNKSDTERLLRAISDALAARRYQDVKDVAHALKGGAGSVGATQLVQLAIRFEKASYDTLHTKAAGWMEELTQAVNASNAALQERLEERRRQTRS